MKFRIEPRGAYVFAEVDGRETPAEMREFLFAVKLACRQHDCPRILLSVRASRPVFKLEEYGLSNGFANDIVTPSCRIALVGDTSELNHAHDYVQLVARQQQMNVRAFKTVWSAQEWLREPEPQPGPDADVQAAASKPLPGSL
jgi:hypothetical protein